MQLHTLYTFLVLSQLPPQNKPLMKDFSFFFLKNLLGSKIRRGFSNVCNDDTSTSTLNQNQPSYTAPSSHDERPSSSSCINQNDNVTLNPPPRKSVTLEEMILQLEVEEAKARREKSGNKNEEITNVIPRRMSCVNNSDILRSARNALNQYPRFSLDGKDAMYRSSFQRNGNLLGHQSRAIDGLKLGRILHLPHSVGGESVIWCKPGVVPTLMGLEAMPLPISKLYNNKNSTSRHAKEKLRNASYSFRNKNLKRREKSELERQQMRHVRDSNVCCGEAKRFGRGGGHGASGGGSSSSGYGVMNPMAVEPVYDVGRPIS